MGINIDLNEYKDLLKVKEKYELLYNALFFNMQVDKYAIHDKDKINLNDIGVLSVLKALEPEAYIEHSKGLIKEYDA